MPSLQEWIHKLEEGEGAGLVKIGTLALVVATLTVIFHLREARNFATQEAMDMGQVARNLAGGNGYTTHFIRPLSIFLLERHRADRQPLLKGGHPDLANAPVYPTLLAGLMKVLPFNFTINDSARFMRYQPEIWIAWFNQFLFFLLVIIVFFLARKLFDSHVAWISAGVVLGAEVFWRFISAGLPTVLLALWFALLTACLVAMDRANPPPAPPPEEGAVEEPAAPVASRSTRWFILMGALAGLLVGLGSLTLYSFGWLIIPVLAFFALYFPGRRLVLCGVAFATMAVVLAPWIVRNIQASGMPFGTATYAVLQTSEDFRGDLLERSLKPSFAEVGFGAVYRKIIQNAADIMRNDLPRLGGSWVAAFFLVALLMPFQSRTLNRVRWYLAMCLVVLLLAQAGGRTDLSAAAPEINSENLLIWMAPVVFIYGAALFIVFLEQLPLPNLTVRFLACVGFVGLVSAPFLLMLMPPRTVPIVYPPYYPPFLQVVSRWVQPNELVMSDMPWAVGWYGDRQCISLTLNSPVSPKSEFFALNDYRKPVSTLVLTPVTLDDPFFSQMAKADKDWGGFVFLCLMKQEVPASFPLQKSPRGYLQDGFFILADRERWGRHGR